MKKTVSFDEAKNILGISKAHLRRLIDRGDVKIVKSVDGTDFIDHRNLYEFKDYQDMLRTDGSFCFGNAEMARFEALKEIRKVFFGR